MFLAWNEIKNNKLRFTLIIGVLMLVSYLLFFLSGLANGLEDMNREAVDKWDADGIILTEESDISLPQSSMSVNDYDGEGAADAAVLGQFSAIASTDDAKADVSIFGIRDDEFIMPEVTEGQPFKETGEVIANDSLRDEGFALGDELSLSSTDETLKIVGFTDHAKFTAAPVLYSNLETVQQIRYGHDLEDYKDQINGIVVRSDNLDNVSVSDDFEMTETAAFIENLPGYSEQKLTLTLMIYFLFVISAVILAIFLYVLTIQKVNIYGVMKAQGISSGYIANSVIAQTFLLSLAGVVLGLVFTMITRSFLPPAVPVAFHTLDLVTYAVVLIIVSILGALFSVRTIVKIDPLDAIGG